MRAYPLDQSQAKRSSKNRHLATLPTLSSTEILSIGSSRHSSTGWPIVSLSAIPASPRSTFRITFVKLSGVNLL